MRTTSSLAPTVSRRLSRVKCNTLTRRQRAGERRASSRRAASRPASGILATVTAGCNCWYTTVEGKVTQVLAGSL
jgi:hypothetical protein